MDKVNPILLKVFCVVVIVAGTIYIVKNVADLF